MFNIKIFKKLFVLGIIGSLFLLLLVFFLRQETYDLSLPGKLYVVNKKSCDLSIYDLENGKLLKTIPIPVEPHELVCVDNKYIVVTNYGNKKITGHELSVVDVRTDEIKMQIPLGIDKPHDVTLVDDEGSLVATVSDESNEIVITDVENGNRLRNIFTEQNYSHLLATNNDSIIFVSNMSSGSVSVINLRDSVVRQINLEKGTEGLDYCKSTNELWVTNNLSNYISIVDLDLMEEIKQLPTGKAPVRFKFSSDEKFGIVTNKDEGSISIYNVERRSFVKEVIIPGQSNLFEKIVYHSPRLVGLCFHPTEPYAFISNSNANKIMVVSLDKLELVGSINVGEIPDGVAVSL